MVLLSFNLPVSKRGSGPRLAAASVQGGGRPSRSDAVYLSSLFNQQASIHLQDEMHQSGYPGSDKSHDPLGAASDLHNSSEFNDPHDLHNLDNNFDDPLDSANRCPSHPSFVTGFVQADGCFHIAFSPAPASPSGWRATPIFYLTQLQTNSSTLLEAVWGVLGRGHGDVKVQERDGCATLRIRGVKAAREGIIPHFERHPLIGGKLADYQGFRQVVEMMSRNEHLTLEGWGRIVDVAFAMNKSGLRKLKRLDLLERVPDKLIPITDGRSRPSSHDVEVASQEGANPWPAPATGVTPSPPFSLVHYVAGVVQGDGGFSVGFRSNGRIDLCFSLGMGNDSMEVMELVRNCLGSGRIQKVDTNNSRLMVTRPRQLAERVFPFLGESRL